ncbi:MAG: ribonuclease HI family protein [Deltaproteobacteria bacterium]|jgi:ribonuclease HI|nr:ribonuclease HI family protein [Deltaproteobacteria bacterium]
MTSQTRHTLYTDGAALGNPGPGGAGAVLQDPAGRTVFRLGVYLGRSTNNEAEYQSLILGARRSWEKGARELDILMDSELVVRQMLGNYKVKAPGLKLFHDRAREALSRFEDWSISHVRREFNAEADRMAGDAAFLGKIGRLGVGEEISGTDPTAEETPPDGQGDGAGGGVQEPTGFEGAAGFRGRKSLKDPPGAS